MGIINEITHVYNAIKSLNRYEINGIISEHLSEYSYNFLTEYELDEIRSEFGSVESFSKILAETFTRNDGSFDNVMINEMSIDENAAKGIKILKNAGRGVIRRLTGKPVGKVVERFGKRELYDIAKFSGKEVSKVGHKDIGRYVTRELAKNTNRNVAKQLEKQAAWLSKNTNMNARQMEEFMAKYAKCPGDCDPKLWKMAFEEEAKMFNNGAKLENGLVRARYNTLARTAGRGVTTAAGSAGKTTMTRGMFRGLKNFGKRTLWKFVKWGGIIFLLIGGIWYFWDDISGWVKRKIGTSDESSVTNRGSIDGIYPKTYGVEYRSENPEDYRII